MGPPFGHIFPPAPTFTDKNVGDLTGKVYIVTGSTSGVGFELAKILYANNGTVYVAARSTEKITNAINQIKSTLPSGGQLSPLVIDLANLKSIKASAQEFLNKEKRLDVVFHNAGLMTPPANSKTDLGHDLEMGTNCLGPFLFNHFLEDVLKQTAAQNASGSGNDVRIVWVTSLLAVSVPEGGIIFDKETGHPAVQKNAMENYMQSKVGNTFIAHETAQRLGKDGILSLSVHPGLMKTELQRNSPALQRVIMGIVFKGPKHGAFSELYAGLSPSVTSEQNGSYILPWGRAGVIPDHIQASMKATADGEPSLSSRFYQWCEQETAPYK